MTSRNKKAILLIILLFGIVTGCNRYTHYQNNVKDQEAISSNDDEKFPTERINIIVPYAPGGGTDSVARALAFSAHKFFNVPISVVNKTGTGGARGMSEGLNSKPDGHTVTLITGELATLNNLDIIDFSHEDFAPIIQLNQDYAALTVRSDSDIHSIDDLIKYKEKNKVRLRIGSSGIGSVWHIASACIARFTGNDFEHVFYNGAAPAVVALLGEEIDGVTVSIAEVLSHVKNDELRIIGVLADERLESLPDVPTFKEYNIDICIGTWRGLAVPRNTSICIVRKLELGFTRAAKDKQFIDMLNKLELGYKLRSSKEFEEFMDEDHAVIRSLIEELNIKNIVMDDMDIK